MCTELVVNWQMFRGQGVGSTPKPTATGPKNCKLSNFVAIFEMHTNAWPTLVRFEFFYLTLLLGSANAIISSGFDTHPSIQALFSAFTHTHVMSLCRAILQNYITTSRTIRQNYEPAFLVLSSVEKTNQALALVCFVDFCTSCFSI